MPDKTARDAIGRALRQVGVTYYGVAADAVLAALGIPPDTTTDDLRAGLAVLRMAEDSLSIWPTSVDARTRGYHEYVAEAGDEIAGGASPAAAVLALAAKLDVDPESRACAEFYADQAKEDGHL